jgi:hypothetical protein
MSPKSLNPRPSSERLVKDIRRATRKHYSEDKIRIVLEGLRGEPEFADVARANLLELRITGLVGGTADGGPVLTRAERHFLGTCRAGRGINSRKGEGGYDEREGRQALMQHLVVSLKDLSFQSLVHVIL